MQVRQQDYASKATKYAKTQSKKTEDTTITNLGCHTKLY